MEQETFDTETLLKDIQITIPTLKLPDPNLRDYYREEADRVV